MAFDELYRRHYPALRAFVFHLLGARHRHEDSEDVVHDAFARAFDAIGDQRFSGDFRRWIFTIARNRSIDLLRGERVRLVSLDADSAGASPPVAAEATTPVAIAEARDEVAWLVAALDNLPERQRSALLLRELAGLSHVEIAETLDTTTGSARQLITRARDGVREAAERDGRDHETRRGHGLRRELLDAAPVLPLAAAGVAVTVGATAGGGIALGKLVATVLAAMFLAGTAGQVGREVAKADDSPRAPERAAVQSADSSVARATAPDQDRRIAPGPRSDSKLSGGVAPAQSKTQATKGEAPRATENAKSGNKPTGAGADALDEVAPKVSDPVNDVVELPGKVVEHVVGGLDGASSPGQTVGNVVGEVTETVDDVTTGLLGSVSR